MLSIDEDVYTLVLSLEICADLDKRESVCVLQTYFFLSIQSDAAGLVYLGVYSYSLHLL